MATTQWPNLQGNVDHTRGLPIIQLSGMEYARGFPSLEKEGYKLYKLPVHVSTKLEVKILKDMLETLEAHGYSWKLAWTYKSLHQIAVLRKRT